MSDVTPGPEHASHATASGPGQVSGAADLATLKATAERYRALVESTGDVVWEVDAAGRYTYLSPNVEAILGYPPGELLGRTPFDVMPESDARRVGTRFAALAAERQPFSLLVHLVHTKDGELRTLECSGRPVLSADGTLAGYRGVDRDITERKAAAAELQTRTDRLRRGEHLEALGRLAAGIAHDFNNALTGILGFAELGLRDPQRTLDQQADLQQIRQAALRAASLTQQLLAFSRQQILEPRHVAVNSLVEQALPLLRRLVTGNIEIRTALGGDAGVVQVDPGQFTHVLINLAVNARDAMPTGGVLTIRTAAISDGSMGWSVLSIGDTGCGMSPEVVARAFEPFFSTKPAGRGTGLGLSSVYGTVTQSGGRVHIETEAGRGTTVTIRLPLSDQPASATLAPTPAHAPSGLNGTVLLVEDETVVRELAQRVLRALGLRVVAARDGAEGLLVARRPDAEVDLLVTDLVMPRMNGWELAEQLRELRPRLPVVFVTGHAESAVVDRVRTLQRAVLVRKPFGPDQLERAIRAAYPDGDGAPP